MIRATVRNLVAILLAGSMKYLSYGTLLSFILFLGVSVATAYGFQQSDPYLLRWSVQLLFVAIVAVVFVVVAVTPTAYRLAKLDGKLNSKTEH